MWICLCEIETGSAGGNSTSVYASYASNQPKLHLIVSLEVTIKRVHSIMASKKGVFILGEGSPAGARLTLVGRLNKMSVKLVKFSAKYLLCKCKNAMFLPLWV